MRDSVYASLREGFSYPIRDALWGHIYLTRGLSELTRSVPFMRLHRILQLGPAFCVYPGATHTRAGHSIGVYHLARRLLIHLVEEGAGEWLNPRGVKSFLCAGLLHDLGHFPYTHSLKELPLQSHEELTGKIIRAEPMRSLVAGAGGDPDFTAAIVDTRIPGGDSELLFYRKLLSGALDPDKLDYLNRDAQYCGVPYGAQDVDFVLSRLHPHRERGIDIDSRGIPSVESVLFSKYLMYRTVYWHRFVRSATAMIKKALLGGLEQGIIAGEELYDLDDQSLFSLMESRGKKRGAGALFSLAALARNGRLYSEAAALAFDEDRHRGLRDIALRSRQEKALAEELSAGLSVPVAPEKLIIDLPEPVSFETGLYVSDEERTFSESSSAFKDEMMKTLVKSLHIVRIFVDPDYEVMVKSSLSFQGILRNTEKWLQL